tara:strand:- start:522 stop:1955 length:1434 start_codon:yes stop_codon:yes gene_type:complete
MPRFVDDTLFASKSKKGLRGSGERAMSKPANAVISRAMLDTIRQRAMDAADVPATTTLRATHRTKSGQPMGWLAAKKPDPSIEYAKSRRGNAAVMRSLILRDGELDEIKTLQSDILRYQTMTTLLEQKEEKKRKKAEEAQHEADWHSAMELDRKRAVLKREAEDRARRAENNVMKEALLKQIAERERQRLVEADQLEHEKEHALRMIQKGMADDRRKAREVEELRKQMSRQLKFDNDQGLLLKRREVEAEAETDRLMAEWTRRKDCKERALKAAKAEEKRLKDAEFAKMLASQSRTLDKRAEEDARRAKRNQEVAALKEEARLAAKAQKEADFMAEVLVQRNAQMALQRAKRREERDADIEFARQSRETAADLAAQEVEKQRARKEFMWTHGALLKDQIASRAEGRVLAKQKELDDTYLRLVTDEVHALRVKQAALERIGAHNATGCATLPTHVTANVLGITQKQEFNEQRRSRALW